MCGYFLDLNFLPQKTQKVSGEAKFSKDEGIKAGSLKMWEATGKDEFFSLMRKFLGTGTYLVGDQVRGLLLAQVVGGGEP